METKRHDEEILRQLFKELDWAILNSLSKNPIVFAESKFNKFYQAIKRKYLGGENVFGQ